MSATDHLLAVVGHLRGIYGKWMLARLFSGALTVAGLVIVSAILVGFLVIGAFIAGYQSLIYYGTEPPIAMLIVGGVAAVITAAVCYATWRRMHGLKKPKPSKRPSLVNQASELMDAFVDGLLAE